MIEPNVLNSFFDKLMSISKTVLEILRNVVIVTTLGYLYHKSHNTIIRIAFWISLAALAVYITSFFQLYRIKKSFFADTTEGQIFGIVLTGIVFTIVGSLVIAFVSQLILEIIKIQVPL